MSPDMDSLNLCGFFILGPCVLNLAQGGHLVICKLHILEMLFYLIIFKIFGQC
jgi:hypothetical protein